MLVEPCGDVNLAVHPQVRRDLAKQVVEAADTYGLEHAFSIGVGVRDVRHSR
jgi:hypothetical protein